MRSNKYVYPYTPFKNLSNKKMISYFSDGGTYSTDYFLHLLSEIIFKKIKTKGKSEAEKIFNLFLNNKIRFGPRSYITDSAKFWIEKLDESIKNNKPLNFTILGFPFKIPVPLKTNRTLPDFGELLSLKQLYEIVQTVNTINNKSNIVYIFTEGVFGKFNHINKSEYTSYKDFLDKMITEFGFSESVKLIPLDEMEKYFDNFNKAHKDKVVQNAILFKKEDAKFMKKYNGAYDSILRIANSKTFNIPDEDLMDIYNDKIYDDKLPISLLKYREKIKKQAIEMILKYFAYLELRDEIDFINRRIDNPIHLSVSPKPQRLGIRPLPDKCKRLPYHSVPVFDTEKRTVSTEYLIDIKRSGDNYQMIFWDKDEEKIPFLYIKTPRRSVI